MTERALQNGPSGPSTAEFSFESANDATISKVTPLCDLKIPTSDVQFQCQFTLCKDAGNWRKVNWYWNQMPSQLNHRPRNRFFLQRNRNIKLWTPGPDGLDEPGGAPSGLRGAAHRHCAREPWAAPPGPKVRGCGSPPGRSTTASGLLAAEAGALTLSSQPGWRTRPTRSGSPSGRARCRAAPLGDRMQPRGLDRRHQQLAPMVMRSWRGQPRDTVSGAAEAAAGNISKRLNRDPFFRIAPCFGSRWIIANQLFSHLPLQFCK